MHSFDSLVKSLEKEELSDGDLEEMLRGKTNIVPYNDLKHVRCIEDILAPYGNAIIFYQETENQGHWCVVIDRGDHYEFFDSYGYAPDEVLPLMPYSGKVPYLRNLLEATDKWVVWNPYQLQSDDPDIATCGYYSFLRIMLHRMPLLKFIKLFTNKKKSADYIASRLTILLALANVIEGKKIDS
jgi:hypothetical protein